LWAQTLLTRKNHLTGVEYRDDPTILAWELMNEPRCTTDPSGDTLQVSLYFYPAAAAAVNGFNWSRR
jgi:endo-1,4-beta-mannosidase